MVQIIIEVIIVIISNHKSFVKISQKHYLFQTVIIIDFHYNNSINLNNLITQVDDILISANNCKFLVLVSKLFSIKVVEKITVRVIMAFEPPLVKVL